MAFRQIGIPARKVIDRTAKKRAAAASSAAEIDAPDPYRFGEQQSQAPALSSEGSASATGDEKDPSGEARARLCAEGGVPRLTGGHFKHQANAPKSDTYGPRMKPALRLIDGKGMPVTRPNGFPRPVAGSPLLYVVGGHAQTVLPARIA